jgi:hypothetical protein
MKRRSSIATLAIAAALMLSVPAAAAGGWQAVRSASARYHSLNQALAAGYSLAGEPCVSEAPGTMGIHAVNMDLAGDLDIVPTRPEILLYLPKDDGDYELIGIEYWSIALANSPNGPVPWFAAEPPAAGWFNPAPSVLGQTFDGPMPGHNPSMPWHYDLHAWLWESNPAGTFAPFNPTLSCP